MAAAAPSKAPRGSQTGSTPLSKAPPKGRPSLSSKRLRDEPVSRVLGHLGCLERSRPHGRRVRVTPVCLFPTRFPGRDALVGACGPEAEQEKETSSLLTQ